MLKAELAKTEKYGFTLLELIIVIIILGILVSLGMVMYTRWIEKSRGAEAKTILGQLRQSQRSYYLQNGNYSDSLDYLEVMLSTVCDSQHFFMYGTSSNLGTAIRCTAGGQNPNSTELYTITVNYDTSDFGGTPGHY
jgi:prepilin-type N-terminal cleavage/methylation domain-containing protein